MPFSCFVTSRYCLVIFFFFVYLVLGSIVLGFFVFLRAFNGWALVEFCD